MILVWIEYQCFENTSNPILKYLQFLSENGEGIWNLLFFRQSMVFLFLKFKKIRFLKAKAMRISYAYSFENMNDNIDSWYLYSVWIIWHKQQV